MKNCISVADVQMCWIVYSSHDTSSAYQREIFVQIQTFGRKQLHNHPGALVPNQEFLRSHCGILNGRIIRNSIESAIGVLQGFYYFSFLFKFKISFFLFLIWRLRCQSGILNFLFPIFHLKAVSTRLVSLAEISWSSGSAGAQPILTLSPASADFLCFEKLSSAVRLGASCSWWMWVKGS